VPILLTFAGITDEGWGSQSPNYWAVCPTTVRPVRLRSWRRCAGLRDAFAPLCHRGPSVRDCGPGRPSQRLPGLSRQGVGEPGVGFVPFV